MVEITFFRLSLRTFKLFNIWSARHEDNKTLLAIFLKCLTVMFSGIGMIVVSFSEALDELKHGTMEVTFTKILYLFAVLACSYKVGLAAFGVDGLYICVTRIEEISKKFKDTSKIEKCLRLHSKLFIVGQLSIVIYTTLFWSVPLTTGSYRPLPFRPALPFLDVVSTPNWQLIYIYEILSTGMLTIVTIAFDTLFCGMMNVCSAILSCICQEIREFEDCIDNHQVSEAKMKQTIIKIIETKMALKNISDINSGSTILHMIYNCSTLTLALYMVSILPFGNMASICMMTLVFVVIFQLWLYCFFGQDVVNQVEILRKDLYFVRWYDASKNFKTMLALTIFEVQNDSYVYAGKIIPLSLETLTEVIKKAYAFYTFLYKSR